MKMQALNKLCLFTLVFSKHHNVSLETLAQDTILLNGVGDRIDKKDRKCFASSFAAGKLTNIFAISAKA